VRVQAAEVEGDGDNSAAPAGANIEDVDPSAMRDINFDEGASPSTHEGLQ
jgi:DNA helicase INO80